MLKLISSGRERDWYLVREWVTGNGKGPRAQVRKCVWNQREVLVALGIRNLHDHYTGYVEKSKGDVTKYYDNGDIRVHGGVTFEGPLEEAGETWVGFDLAHMGDEHIPSPLRYATDQCESLAAQVRNRNKNPMAAALGRLTSPAKAKAARENGRKGGRPKKSK